MAERLEKRVASLAGWSRRQARDAIRAGRIASGAGVLDDPATSIGPEPLWLDGAPLVEPPRFAVFHKPVDVQCTVGDPWGRPNLSTVASDLLALGLHPVGRLDADTSGLLPFSAVGPVTQRLLHPRHAVAKVYVATVEGEPGPGLVATLAAGVDTADGAHVAEVRAMAGSRITLSVTEGKHRMVRRILANAGFPVRSLHRVAFGALTLGDLPAGAWRVPDAAEQAWLQGFDRAGDSR